MATSGSAPSWARNSGSSHHLICVGLEEAILLQDLILDVPEGFVAQRASEGRMDERSARKRSVWRGGARYSGRWSEKVAVRSYVAEAPNRASATLRSRLQG